MSTAAFVGGTRPGRRRSLLAAAALGLCAAGLALLGAIPTGAPRPEGVLPSGARVAAVQHVGDAVVLVAAEGSLRRVVVARRGAKGWFGLAAPPPATDAPVAWTTTSGGRGVPALSVVYGRAGPGAAVTVVWADGARRSVRAGADGTWLAVRAGRVGFGSVRIVEADGAVTEVRAR